MNLLVSLTRTSRLNDWICSPVSVYRSKCSLTDRYRLHLSAADLLFVLALPFWAVDAAMADWRFGAATCVGVHVIYTVNLYGSVLILAFISLDRYLAVVRATDTNTGELRQLLAHRLVYVGECGKAYMISFFFFLNAALLSTFFFHHTPQFLTSFFISPCRCMVACWPPGGARLDICPDSGRRRRGHSVPAILPRRQCSSLGCSLPPAAGPGGSGDPRTGTPGVLLRHRHQVDPRPSGGPEAEAASSQDHHRVGSLLLRVLAALRSGHLCGCSSAPGGPATQLQPGGCHGCVAGGG